VLAEALQVAFNRLTDVFGGFGPGSALGNASRQSRASCHEHSVLVWFQINAILHYSAFYQSASRRFLPLTLIEQPDLFLRRLFHLPPRLQRAAHDPQNQDLSQGRPRYEHALVLEAGIGRDEAEAIGIEL